MRLWKNIFVICLALPLASCGSNDETSEASVTDIAAGSSSLPLGADTSVRIDFQVASTAGIADEVDVTVRIDAALEYVIGSSRFDISTNVDREPDDAAVCGDGSQILVYRLGGILIDNNAQGFTPRHFTFDVIGSALTSSAFIRAEASTVTPVSADCSVVPSDANVELSVG